MKSEMIDAFNALDIQLTEAIEPSMTDDEAHRLVEELLMLRQMRERVERLLPEPDRDDRVVRVAERTEACGSHHRWTVCPVHGRCTCPSEQAAPYDRNCPLHGGMRR